jgi:hypothetical protein
MLLFKHGRILLKFGMQISIGYDIIEKEKGLLENQIISLKFLKTMS